MSTVNYLSKGQMKARFGMEALGYTEDGQIYLQKGMDKKTENIVRAHEAEHVKNGENGPFLKGIADILGLGGDVSAPGEAAGVQVAAFEQILPMLQEQLRTTRGQFDPFITAGAGAIPELQKGFQAPLGTTAGGLDEILNQIMGGDAFGGLVEERQRGLQSALASGGLRRSGTALKEAAAIPTDVALELENLLFGRQAGAEGQRISGLQELARGGQTAVGTSATTSSDMLTRIMQAITGKAEAEASGILGTAQAEQSGVQNLLNLGGTLGSAFLMAPKAPAPKV